MGTSRVCGPACHYARRAKCNCWCGGLFHGKRGAQARKAFVEVFGYIPSKEQDGDTWNQALQAAKNAR